MDGFVVPRLTVSTALISSRDTRQEKKSSQAAKDDKIRPREKTMRRRHAAPKRVPLSNPPDIRCCMPCCNDADGSSRVCGPTSGVASFSGPMRRKKISLGSDC